MKAGPLEPHPLFPLEEDEDEAPAVAWIHVTRFEGQRGQVYCSHLFAADELTDLEEVQRLYGGGMYEFIARGPGLSPGKKGNITTRRRYTLGGPSLPLDGEATPTPAPAPAQERQAAPTEGNTGLLVAVLQMSQQNLQAMMQMMQQNTAATMNMVTAMQSSTKTDAAAMVDAIGKLSMAASESQARFFEAMMKNGNQSGGADAIVKGMEMGIDIAAASASGEGDETSKILDTAKSFVEAFAANKNGPPRAPGEPAIIDAPDAAPPVNGA